MNLHIIMHESFEAPAAIAQWAEKRRHGVNYTRLYQGEPFPKNCGGFDFLVIMGGPQSPATTIEECPHFDSKKEQHFIKMAIDAGKRVLGVCLGAQMIGQALGAAFDHSPHREIGVFDLTLTDAAKTDPFFSTLPKTFPCGHWHGDMPGLTPNAQVLATSAGCPRQIVKYSSHVYGFQCHFEFTPEAIDGMVQNCGHELDEHRGRPYIQTAAQLRINNYSGMNGMLFGFLDYFCKV